MKTRMKARMSPLWICGLATLCIGAGVPHAFAQAQIEPGSSIKVKYSPLELLTDSGTAGLYKRIERAAHLVCEKDSSPSDPFHLYHRRKCETSAVAKAVRDVNSRGLTAMYREKHGTEPIG